MFPLADGTYYVAHGGNSKLLNHHFRNLSQKYALDIVKLNAYGDSNSRRDTNADYSSLIYNEAVFCPCAGTVTSAIDGFPDLALGQRDPKNPAGNHVLISAEGTDIYIGFAHLKNGTVSVKAGEKVCAGQSIGRVGNSGNTTLPHLHIHAKRGGNPGNMLDGVGVPMRFAGQWLARNSVVRARSVSASS